MQSGIQTLLDEQKRKLENQLAAIPERERLLDQQYKRDKASLAAAKSQLTKDLKQVKKIIKQLATKGATK